MQTTRPHPVLDRGQRHRNVGRHRRLDRRSRLRRRFFPLLFGVAGLFALLAVVASGGIDSLIAGAAPPVTSMSPATSMPPPTLAESAATAAATGSPTPAAWEMVPSPQPEPVLRLAGPVPAAGRGTFAYATGHGEVLGRAGPLRRYRVAVEAGADEDVEEFAETVDLVLGDTRSWIASGRLRLQRVPDGAGHDFTIYLATARTAQKMCAAGWVDIRINGKPFTSCRTQGKAIINLDRWRHSVDDYVAAEVPLTTYREYVINHEVGHELGYGHERCPGVGRPAPIMQTQTLGLKGCTANPWPYLDGVRYAGPQV
ncbi:MAG TPA: DUF3152 domain-containing protein [Micromonospora sp.]|nr:DUF3152 domain-containing protein [Micromonospora sp.]